jgi:hypothetical protein
VSIEICKPFVSYVVKEQMRTDDADVFVIPLPFEIEDTNKTGEWLLAALRAAQPAARVSLQRQGSLGTARLRRMNECWRAAGRHSPEQRRIGRRFYGNRRERQTANYFPAQK